MSKNASWLIGIIIFLIFVFGIGYLFFYTHQSRQQESIISSNESLVSSLFETKEWIGLYPGGVSLRIASDNNENLLLKHNNKDIEDIVYSYNSATKQLQLVNAETWANATSEIIDCNSQVGKEPRRILIDRETNKLLIDDKEVPNIKGRVQLRYQFTLGGDKFAILSASGKKASSLLPFLGEGGAFGTHYHQVFNFPGLMPIGSAVELPFTTEKATYSGCWSSGEKFIVYFHALNFNLAIVDVR